MKRGPNQIGAMPACMGETLSWRYLKYAKTHLIVWNTPAAMLYAGQDHLTSHDTVDDFASRFG